MPKNLCRHHYQCHQFIELTVVNKAVFNEAQKCARYQRSLGSAFQAIGLATDIAYLLHKHYIYQPTSLLALLVLQTGNS